MSLILPVYLLSIAVYSCIIFIRAMKQTDVGKGCNCEVITFDYGCYHWPFSFLDFTGY